MSKVLGFVRKFKGTWVRALVSNAAFGAYNVLDFTDVSPVNTDLARQLRKGYIACAAVRVKYRATVPAGGAATLYNTRRQRGCNVFAKIDQPAMEYAQWEGERPISEVWFASQMANLPATKLVDMMPDRRPEVPPTIVDPATRNVIEMTSDDNVRSPHTWEDLSDLGVALNSGGAPVAQDIDDVYPVAFTMASRRAGEDLLPLDYFTSEGPRTPVKITVRVSPTESSITPGLFGAGTTFTGFGGAGVTPTVELWLYVVPMRADRDPLPLGMTYAYRVVGRRGPTLVMDPARSYRFVGVAPDFESTSTDTGLRFFYDPPNWPTFEGGKIKWQDRQGGGAWQDFFPLFQTAGQGPLRRDVLEMWNTCAARGWEAGMPRDAVAPLLFPLSAAKGASRLNDRGVANTVSWNTVIAAAPSFSPILGAQSFSPAFPLACTSYIDEGFPGFGDALSDCPPQIYLDPDDRPTVNVFEVWQNPAGQKTVAVKDSGTANCGCADGAKPQYTSSVDNKLAPTAVFAEPMVPKVALRTFLGKVAAVGQLANVPPDTLARVNAQQGVNLSSYDPNAKS